MRPSEFPRKAAIILHVTEVMGLSEFDEEGERLNKKVKSDSNRDIKILGVTTTTLKAWLRGVEPKGMKLRAASAGLVRVIEMRRAQKRRLRAP